MISLASLLSVGHLVGLALAMGAATVKVALLLKCRADPSFVPGYLQAVKPITRLIVLGIVLLTLSGIGWLVRGYPFTPLLAVKLALVAAVWVLGPVIDNVAEPRFRALAPAAGEAPSPAFVRAQARYLTLEVVATALFYVITVGWILR